MAEGSRAKTPIETTGGGGVTDLSTGAKGAGAASPGGAQSPSGENDYYATLRDASQDSPTRRRQVCLPRFYFPPPPPPHCNLFQII